MNRLVIMFSSVQSFNFLFFSFFDSRYQFLTRYLLLFAWFQLESFFLPHCFSTDAERLVALSPEESNDNRQLKKPFEKSVWEKIVMALIPENNNVNGTSNGACKSTKEGSNNDNSITSMSFLSKMAAVDIEFNDVTYTLPTSRKGN